MTAAEAASVQERRDASEYFIFDAAIITSMARTKAKRDLSGLLVLLIVN